MGLVDIYAKKYAAAVPAQEKKAEGDAAAEQTVQLSDEQIDQALATMSDEELSTLAKEVAADVKASSAPKAEEKKEAAPEAAPKAEEKKASAVEKFAALLEKELKGEVAKEAAPAPKAEEKKEAEAVEPSDEEKVAEEYFAAGRIFAQGFLTEVNGKVETK